MDAKVSAAPSVYIDRSADESGQRAARRAADALSRAINERGHARVIFASAPSQESMLRHLSSREDVDWTRVSSFHMDEYLGLRRDHPAGFGQWLRARLPSSAQSGFSPINTDGDLHSEVERYAALIAEQPIDVVCLGVGVNGHIAFNEPSDTDPDDEIARTVTLDTTSRQQQVDEGLFPNLTDVPTHALTLTIPALLSGRTLVCSVIGSHKADAVVRALRGPIGPACPASYLRTHADASWFLDADAAAGVSDQGTATLAL